MARVLALCGDLMFGSRIAAQLQGAGEELELLADAAAVQRAAAGPGAGAPAGARRGPHLRAARRGSRWLPAGGEGAGRGRRRAAGCRSAPRTLGFYSHVEADVRERADWRRFRPGRTPLADGARGGGAGGAAAEDSAPPRRLAGAGQARTGAEPSAPPPGAGGPGRAQPTFSGTTRVEHRRAGRCRSRVRVDDALRGGPTRRRRSPAGGRLVDEVSAGGAGPRVDAALERMYNPIGAVTGAWRRAARPCMGCAVHTARSARPTPRPTAAVSRSMSAEGTGTGQGYREARRAGAARRSSCSWRRTGRYRPPVGLRILLSEALGRDRRGPAAEVGLFGRLEVERDEGAVGDALDVLDARARRGW